MSPARGRSHTPTPPQADPDNTTEASALCDGSEKGILFDHFAGRYDAWYEGELGRVAFPLEVDALRPLLFDLPQPWIEVGVGTGRFAAALGVGFGVDPAPGALPLAQERGVTTSAGRGEVLPFRDHTFGAALLVVTLRFVADPGAVLTEVGRVLRPDGGIVIGLVPAESAWGKHYRKLAASGHPYYSLARFFTRAETHELPHAAGFRVVSERSALFQPPGAELRLDHAVSDIVPEAGFLGLLARRY